MLELFDTRSGTSRPSTSRSWWPITLLQLAAAELASPWAQHPGVALPGMMLHQDGSSHEWVPGRWWDLIVTMDDATSDIYSAFFVAEEGTMRASRGVRGDPGQGPVLLALRRPRQPLLEHARGRRQGGQGHPDPGRPRPGAARHRVDPGLLARGKGALGAHVRHLAEAPAPGTQARRHHRHGRGQPLPQGGLPATTQRPLRDPGRGPGRLPARSTTSCASTRNAPSQTTTRCATSAWHFRSPPAATAAITSRPGSASTNTPTAQWPSSMDRDVWRDTTPMANRSTAKPARPRDPRDRPAPCGQVDSRRCCTDRVSSVNTGFCHDHGYA